MEALNNLFVNISAWIASWLSVLLAPWAVTLVMDLLSIVLLLGFCLATVLWLTLLERKIIGRIQDRIGPNRWGPLGLLQPIADAMKMIIKEDITPTGADRWVFNLAPIIITIPALLIYAVIPFGRGMVATDINIGILYVVALGAITTIAVLMAGWSSNNKYALLGGFRVVAQLVSYEIPMVLSIVAVVLLSGSMSMVKIVEAQNVPHLVAIPLVFLVYLVSAFAELYRAPFDMIEADSEIVAGYFIEYSGMKFALFFLAEYINLFAISAIVTTLFLAGWRGPILPPYVWFLIKCYAVIFFIMWVRGTLPRIRIDHLIALAWKFLVPLALVNLMVVGLIDKLVAEGVVQTLALLVANMALAAAVIVILFLAARRGRSRKLKRITSQ